MFTEATQQLNKLYNVHGYLLFSWPRRRPRKLQCLDFYFWELGLCEMGSVKTLKKENLKMTTAT